MCDIHTKKIGSVPLRKEAKRCGSARKIKTMYERKRRFLVNEKGLCDSHTKLSEQFQWKIEGHVW